MTPVHIVLKHHNDASRITAVFADRNAAVAFMRDETIRAEMQFTGAIERPCFDDAEYWISENDGQTDGWSIEIQKHKVR